MMNEARILSVNPRHPNQQKRETQATHPSCVEVVIDTGLKSGRLTVVRLDLGEAVNMTFQMAQATQRAFHAREGMPS